MLLRVPLKICGQIVFSQMTDKLLISSRPVVVPSSDRGGGAAGSAATPHRSALRRDQELVDCDMPDRSNTELSTPLRHFVTTADGSPLLTDAMLVDQDESNPRIPLSSGD
jgi:hypothetical protein